MDNPHVFGFKENVPKGFFQHHLTFRIFVWITDKLGSPASQVRASNPM